MIIDDICAAVKCGLIELKNARVGKAIDHTRVEKFQDKIKDMLNAASNGYNWDIEKKANGRSERDSIDILGQAKNSPKWIIEIDATRSDQVSQKLLSRMALWGLDAPINYVAILYPDTMGGKNACEKYLRYGSEILRKINMKSSLTGIFVNPAEGSVEVNQTIVNGKKVSDHFEVNGMECSSMNEAAAEAVKLYLRTHRISYAKLKQEWGKFVLDQRGPSRYKNIHAQTADGVTVYTYTQFRQYGIGTYWADFERICRKKRVKVTKLRKLYLGGAFPYMYCV